jgi:hypothetical protein
VNPSYSILYERAHEARSEDVLACTVLSRGNRGTRIGPGVRMWNTREELVTVSLRTDTGQIGTGTRILLSLGY